RGQITRAVAALYLHVRKQAITDKHASRKQIVNGGANVDTGRIGVVAADVSASLADKVPGDIVGIAAANRHDALPAVEQRHPVAHQLKLVRLRGAGIDY